MKRIPSKLILLAVGLCTTPFAFAEQSIEPPYWYWPHMWGGGWGMWWVFPLLVGLFMVAMCAAMFFAMFRGAGHSHRGMRWHAGDPTFSALQLLNERFAKGEIQKAEYEEKKAAIQRSGP